MNRSVSVFCLWRDSEKHIFKTLEQLEKLETLKGFAFSFYFYENDSNDDTASVLSDWLSTRNGEILSETLNAPKFGSVTDPERMKFLCECRNKCKKLAGANNSELSLLIDSDVEFNNENFLIQLSILDDMEDVAMVTANIRQKIPDYTFGLSQDSYYDSYPFRDKHGNGGMYFSDCPSYKKEDQFFWKLGIPIECMAAFGGFAIIRSKIFNGVKWTSDLHCDHVNMCFDISRKGRICIHPKSKVYVDVDTSCIDTANSQEIGRRQKEFYDTHFA